MRRSLYIMAVLLCSAVEVDAMSLNDALQSEYITMEFGNGGTIWCQYSDEKGFDPHPGYINEQDYIYEGNTYFISMNTSNILNNTSIEGGVNNYSFLANIGGSNNISLQNLQSNNKVNDEVIRSITFAGDNSQYTGTLYLHPSITRIVFEKEESVISNISIPREIPNNSIDKDDNPFIIPNEPKNIIINLLDNSSYNNIKIPNNLSIKFNTKYNKKINTNTISVSKKSELIINNCSLIIGRTLKNINTKLHITSGKYEIKAKDIEPNPIPEPTPGQHDSDDPIPALMPEQPDPDPVPEQEIKYATVQCEAKATFDVIKNISVFEYLLSCDCNTISNTITIEVDRSSGSTESFLSEDDILSELIYKGINSCETCGIFNAVNIDSKKSSIYLQSNQDTNIHYWILKCSACCNTFEQIGERYIIDDDLEIEASYYKNSSCKNCKALYTSVEKPFILTGKCVAQFNYENNYTTFSYANLKCYKCDNVITGTFDNTNRRPSELFSNLSCPTCKQNFPAQNIEVTSWLYPDNSCFNNSGYDEPPHATYVLCSLCSTQNGFIFINEKHDGIIEGSELEDKNPEEFCISPVCNAKIIDDIKYAISQLPLIKDALGNNCQMKNQGQ